MHTCTLREVGGSTMIAVPPSLLDTLNQLLTLCDTTESPSPEEQEWLDAPVTGRELL